MIEAELLPCHIAGRASTQRRSRRHGRSRSPGICRSDQRRLGRGSSASCFALLKLTKELVRRYKEWVFLKHSADDDYRVGTHDVNHHSAAKLGGIVSSNKRVRVLE